MADALPGQNYYYELRDRRGNALPSVVVEVLESGTAVVLTTVTSDDDGLITIPLTDALADRVLVDLRFSSTTLGTWTRAGITLL